VDPLGQALVLSSACCVSRAMSSSTSAAPDRVLLHERTCELNVDRDSHEQLLRAVVELALEASATRIVCERAALTSCPEVVELEADSLESLERLPLCVLDVRKLRGNLPRRTTRSLSVITHPASSAPAPRGLG
jgi:hypothetical protein